MLVSLFEILARSTLRSILIKEYLTGHAHLQELEEGLEIRK